MYFESLITPSRILPNSYRRSNSITRSVGPIPFGRQILVPLNHHTTPSLLGSFARSADRLRYRPTTRCLSLVGLLAVAPKWLMLDERTDGGVGTGVMANAAPGVR